MGINLTVQGQEVLLYRKVVVLSTGTGPLKYINPNLNPILFTVLTKNPKLLPGVEFIEGRTGVRV